MFCFKQLIKTIHTIMILKIALRRTRIFFILMTIILFIACQKDDEGQPQLQEVQETKSITATSTVYVDEIPEIMEFVFIKTDKDGYFQISRSNTGLRSNEPDLILGELETREILQVTNQYNRSNYTFLLTSIESTDQTVKSTFNLIIKESSMGLYSYIMEYRPDENWTYDYRNRETFSSFTGEIFYYDIEGKYLAKETLSNGAVTSAETRNNCDDNSDPDSNTGGDGTNDGNDGNDGTSDGNDGGDSGNGITIYEEENCNVPCTHPAHNPHTDPCEHPTCETTVVINYKSSQKVDKHTRNPCNDTPENCHYPNNDPCPCNADGTGCLEVEEDTNDTVGVISVDLSLVFAIDAYIEPDLTDEQIDWIFSSESGVAFAELALEALQNGEEVDFDEQIINSIENEKIKCLNEKLGQAGNTDLSNILSNFEGESEFGIKIESKDHVFFTENGETREVAGLTSYRSDSNIMNISISVSQSTASPALSVVRTIIHEYIHAEIFRLVFTSSPAPEDQSFRDTYMAYENGNFQSSPSHETMADLYIDILTQALADYHQNVLVGDYNYLSNNGEIDLTDFYEGLAWQGLKENNVQAYLDLPQERKDAIEAAINQYFHATTTNCPD